MIKNPEGQNLNAAEKSLPPTAPARGPARESEREGGLGWSGVGTDMCGLGRPQAASQVTSREAAARAMARRMPA